MWFLKSVFRNLVNRFRRPAYNGLLAQFRVSIYFFHFSLNTKQYYDVGPSVSTFLNTTSPFHTVYFGTRAPRLDAGDIGSKWDTTTRPLFRHTTSRPAHFGTRHSGLHISPHNILASIFRHRIFKPANYSTRYSGLYFGAVHFGTSLPTPNFGTRRPRLQIPAY